MWVHGDDRNSIGICPAAQTYPTGYWSFHAGKLNRNWSFICSWYDSSVNTPIVSPFNASLPSFLLFKVNRIEHWLNSFLIYVLIMRAFLIHTVKGVFFFIHIVFLLSFLTRNLEKNPKSTNSPVNPNKVAYEPAKISNDLKMYGLGLPC